MSFVNSVLGRPGKWNCPSLSHTLGFPWGGLRSAAAFSEEGRESSGRSGLSPGLPEEKREPELKKEPSALVFLGEGTFDSQAGPFLGSGWGHGESWQYLCVCVCTLLPSTPSSTSSPTSHHSHSLRWV